LYDNKVSIANGEVTFQTDTFTEYPDRETVMNICFFSKNFLETPEISNEPADDFDPT
jgi:hypothetical protein